MPFSSLISVYLFFLFFLWIFYFVWPFPISRVCGNSVVLLWSFCVFKSLILWVNLVGLQKNLALFSVIQHTV